MSNLSESQSVVTPAQAAAELLRRRKERNKIANYYPDEGPLRRELYVKHLEFFNAGGSHAAMVGCPLDCDGSPHRERLMCAANRIGKTEGVGAYEVVLHLTGRYPPWWQGKRFDRAIKSWAAGDTSKTVRDILQEKLLGPPAKHGTGMLPAEYIRDTSRKQGIPDAIETIWIRHISGGTSVLQLKSYDQRRESFQGTEQDLIWLDEEPPMDIYTECLMRTMTTGGIIMLTFTPLKGMSDVVKSFVEINQQ